MLLLGECRKRSREPYQVLLVTWESEPQPRGLFGETAHQDTGAAKVAKQTDCGWGLHQSEQRCTADHSKSGRG